MKRFQFPLDRVRRWRLEQLNVEELKLQKVRADRELLAEAKRQVREGLAQSRGDVLAQPAFTGSELENLDSYAIHVRERVRYIEKLEQEAEAKVVEQRTRVLEARRQFELLDGLRAKALVQWRAAGDREQETLAAELYLSKFTRNA
ncbi:MAG TPA: hypothetical protein VKT81_01605 [Bryobacteraceae bacterium]|nr:hypothetical protein [Bryobacteraceae bacterium]